MAAALWVVRSVVYIFILTKTSQCNPYFDQNFCVQPIFWPKVSEQAKSWPILLRTPHFLNKTSLWKPYLWHHFQVKTHDHVPAAKISLIGQRGRDVPMTILLYNGKWVQLTIKPAALDWLPQPPKLEPNFDRGIEKTEKETIYFAIISNFEDSYWIWLHTKVKWEYGLDICLLTRDRNVNSNISSALPKIFSALGTAVKAQLSCYSSYFCPKTLCPPSHLNAPGLVSHGRAETADISQIRSVKLFSIRRFVGIPVNSNKEWRKQMFSHCVWLVLNSNWRKWQVLRASRCQRDLLAHLVPELGPHLVQEVEHSDS